MSSVRERALARLSVSAFAVDAMVVTLFVVGGHELIRRYMPTSPDWVYILAVPIVLILHFLVVEFLAGGVSIGRLSTGLYIRDEKTGAKPKLSSSFKRCGSVFMTMGLPSLSSTKLPNYNKIQERCLCSDWVGSIIVSDTPPNRHHIPAANQSSKQTKVDISRFGLQVLDGPHKGNVKQFRQGKKFPKNKMFIVGRDAKLSDIVLSNDKSVSMVHFRIALKNSNFYIIDGRSSSEKSKLGTFLNGSKIDNHKPRSLKFGDIIKAGQTTMRVL
ncbi:MAG: FHA domain-containing protein [Rhizobiaceae bacterium]|nr:FHA domain-containing protein [Rhizobiaceae bacterium]